MTGEYTLYGTPFSPYTAKLRAFLDYKNLPYKDVLATDKRVKKIIVPKTGLEYLPVLLTPAGDYLQDTAAIIEGVEKGVPERPILPRQGLARFISMLLQLLGDEWLVMPAMHYRWNFSANASYLEQALGAASAEHLPAFAQRIRGRRMALRYRAKLSSLGITGLMVPAIEASYEGNFLPALNRHFHRHDFILGARPTLGDFAFFGPLYAQLYQDPVPGKHMRMEAPYVARWIERLKGAQGLSDSAAGLELSASLTAILARMMGEHLPVLSATVAAVASHFNRGARDVPSTLGTHRFQIESSVGERCVQPFLQWKLQAVLECYAESSERGRQQIDAFLGKIKARDLTRIRIEHRLVRINNRLFFAGEKRV